MNRDGLRKIIESNELTPGEKKYIMDWQYHMGGSFSQALFQAISKADETNLYKLNLGFPEEVQGYKAWTRGDLYERASRIADGSVDFIQEEEESNGKL